MAEIYRNMKRLGYNGGKLIIDHCFNTRTPESIKKLALAEFPEAEVRIEPTRGLCSFYAERGGLIIGFEVN